MPAICVPCQRSFRTYNNLVGHYRFVHPDEEPPPREEAQVETVPEGFTEGQKLARPAKTKSPARAKQPGPEPQADVSIPPELPSDFMGRVKVCLQVHEAPPDLTNHILGVLRLHPEAHNNAFNFGNLLHHICSTTLQGRSFLAKIPLLVTEVFPAPAEFTPWLGGAVADPAARPYMPQPQQYPGYGNLWAPWPPGPQGQQYPGLYGPLPQDTELKTEVQALRAEYSKVVQLLEAREQQEAEKEQKTIISNLQQQVAGLQAQAGKGGSQDQNTWLDAYLKERDKREDEKEKRYQELVHDLSTQAQQALKEAADAKGGISIARQEGAADEARRRQEVRDEMQKAGWTPGGTKTPAELQHDLTKQIIEVAPDKLEKGLDKLGERLERVVTAGGGKEVKPPPEKKPISPEQLAQRLELEDGILATKGATG